MRFANFLCFTNQLAPDMLSLLGSILSFWFALSKSGAHNRTHAPPIENIC